MTHIPKARTWLPYELTALRRSGKALDVSSLEAYAEKPVEYITGLAQFKNLDLSVSPAVLIPRIETEILADLVWVEFIKRAQESKANRHSYVEIGTGSGAITAWLLSHMRVEKTTVAEQWREFHLVDISAEALRVAQQNVEQVLREGLPTPIQLHWHQSDLFSQLQAAHQFSIIVANLPYIPTEIVSTLDASVRDFEPRVALDGGIDGFRIITRLLDSAPAYLQPNGVIWLEVDSTHTAEFFEPYKPHYMVSFFTDQFGKHRFVRLQLQ